MWISHKRAENKYTHTKTYVYYKIEWFALCISVFCIFASGSIVNVQYASIIGEGSELQKLPSALVCWTGGVGSCVIHISDEALRAQPRAYKVNAIFIITQRASSPSWPAGLMCTQVFIECETQWEKCLINSLCIYIIYIDTICGNLASSISLIMIGIVRYWYLIFVSSVFYNKSFLFSLNKYLYRIYKINKYANVCIQLIKFVFNIFFHWGKYIQRVLT